MESAPNKYTFKYIVELALRHRKELIAANIIALLAVIASVPIPLLIPLLVDEILLDKPGKVVEIFNAVFSGQSHDPVFYIAGILIVTVFLRVTSGRSWSAWSKRDVTSHGVFVALDLKLMSCRKVSRTSEMLYEGSL